MVKIKSVEDIRSIQNKIIEQLVLGKLTYFSLTIGEEDEFSLCFFTPTSDVSKNQSMIKAMIMVDDYEKLLKVLLSHPKISDIEYDEKNNVIYAVFESPYPISQGQAIDGVWDK